MTSAQRVRRAQLWLQSVALLSAILWGGATALALLAIVSIVRWWRPAFAGGNAPLLLMSLLAVATGALVLWRARFVLSRTRVALWMEEHVAELAYALVTASDPRVTADKSLLEAAVASSDLDRAIRPALLSSIARAAIVAAIAAGALLAASTPGSRAVQGIAHRALERVGVHTPMPSRLLSLSVRVVGPAYAGAATSSLDDPSAITALVGSSITVTGAGGKEGVRADLAEGELRLQGRGDEWHVSFVMPVRAGVLRLSDRRFERAIAIIPVVDQPPVVTLTAPTRDTVWRAAPASSIEFSARTTDDVGLDRGHFEYTVTSGSGEIFKARTATFGESRFGDSRNGELRAALSLPSLKLAEGDVLSVRAIIADNNSLTGPGTVTSDTRTFRVARADEYDSLAVEAAPPPPMERSLLTERMLIISAESLFNKRSSLAKEAYVRSAGGIGSDQAALRKRVYDILYEQGEAGGDKGVEGDDEELDPQLVLNRDMKEAYDAMWDAERALNMAEIPDGLPAMRRALRALDRARLANRLYLRGRPPRIVVNVEKVRLTGKERGVSGTIATPRSRSDSVAARRWHALDAALGIARSDPQRFADELTGLRAEAAADNPALAAALGKAVDAVRKGNDATAPLIQARRALLGAPRTGNAAVRWTGTWSGVR